MGEVPALSILNISSPCCFTTIQRHCFPHLTEEPFPPFNTVQKELISFVSGRVVRAGTAQPLHEKPRRGEKHGDLALNSRHHHRHEQTNIRLVNYAHFWITTLGSESIYPLSWLTVIVVSMGLSPLVDRLDRTDQAVETQPRRP